MSEDHMMTKRASKESESRRDPKILDWRGNRKALEAIGGAQADIRRLHGYKITLTTRGGFSETDAHEIVHSSETQTKEACSQWLRDQGAKLREAKQIGKGSPVRRFKMLSLPEISDLADHMMEVCRSPGPQLRALIRECLNVNSHRAALAKNQSCEFDAAVQIDAQCKASGKSRLDGRELARRVGINPSQILRWRRQDRFKMLVEQVAERIRRGNSGSWVVIEN
jgi:hypothetical protein